MHARQRTASGEIGEGDRLYQEFPHRIIAELESGTVPWVKPWSRAKVSPGLPRNASGAPSTGAPVKEPAAVAAWLNTATLLASRSSVLALAGRISLDDVQETDAGKQSGRSIPSAIQAILFQGTSKHFHFRSRPRPRFTKGALPGGLKRAAALSTAASLSVPVQGRP
ncbi:ArdC family protein [Mesorhizobium onobrychidis]|uniref:DUF1738 domain-containing protein n=1 Tax=Mesorhizobium onobrychidis TaxID=2775404 RepID=A0ABY5QVU4_9HYPH|nr:ArdC family protein [Mesorhizobium onobrychidis]UVC15331.1 DUF1738 domain-containing protein [Mesorhizobium onobrychidis]